MIPFFPSAQPCEVGCGSVESGVGGGLGAVFVQPSLSFTLSPAPFNLLRFLSRLPQHTFMFIYLAASFQLLFFKKKNPVFFFFQPPAFLCTPPPTQRFKSWGAADTQQVAVSEGPDASSPKIIGRTVAQSFGKKRRKLH